MDQQAGPRRTENPQPGFPAGNQRSPAGIAKKIDGVAGGTLGRVCFKHPAQPAHFPRRGGRSGDTPGARWDRPLPAGVRVSDALGAWTGAHRFSGESFGVNPSLSITAQGRRRGGVAVARTRVRPDQRPGARAAPYKRPCRPIPPGASGRYRPMPQGLCETFRSSR